jgi:hypothetical protein
MPNEIQAFSVPDIQAMAQSVAKSRLFGLDQEQAFTLMLLAQSEGIHPIKAVQRYHVIQGRPAMKADAMLADFLRIGGTVEWMTESDDREACTAAFKHPKFAPLGKIVRFGIADAKAAGLANKEVWKQYPSSMLRARVISIGVRMIAPGIVAGLYTPEEVQDFAPTIDVESRPVPEHHAVNHDNGTGHGSGAYAEPDDVKAYQGFIEAEVVEVNQHWCDRLTNPPDGEVLTEADGQVTDTWELSGHLLKWAKSQGWVNAPAEIRAGQRDKFAAVAWKNHKNEIMDEARAYFKRKWNEKLRSARAKAAKAAGRQGKRENPEVLELREQDEAMDAMLQTSEAGSRG